MGRKQAGDSQKQREWLMELMEKLFPLSPGPIEKEDTLLLSGIKEDEKIHLPMKIQIQEDLGQLSPNFLKARGTPLTTNFTSWEFRLEASHSQPT